jgi:phosphoglycolate phosphatase-like HAD superfamily hydrolase
MKKTVIFDLDGTLAIIDRRRDLSMIGGKRDWDVFFDPINIKWDDPNTTVITMAQILYSQGFKIVILSGRSARTQDATINWLDDNDVPFDDIHMRPTDKKSHFMPDNMLKQNWLFTVLKDDDVFAVFDDRQQVVDMWRDNGLTVFQVADGDF